jgi:colicin import membrane protein
MKTLLACLFALLAASPVLAQGDAAERARIREERSAAEARYAEEQKTCRAHFAVTDCIDKVTREHNARLADLRRQENLLNDAERKRRAAESQKQADERNSPQKQQEAEDKRAKALADQQERDARAAEKAAKRAEQDAQRAARTPSEKTPKGQPSPQGTPRDAKAAHGSGPTEQEAAQNRADYEARQKEAQQHKAEVAERNAKRSKPAASELPPPR